MADLDDLAFFQALSSHSSLTATARELGLSLSAVSKRLAQLEGRLGVQLIQRTTRRLALTAEGEHYTRRGRAILDDLAELENALSDRHNQLSGRLRINATFGFGRSHVAPLIGEFVQSHPAVEVLLELSDYPRNLLAHDLDIGIMVGQPPDSRLIARRLLANRRVLCAAPRYLERYGRPQRHDELSGHNCLVVRENDSDHAVWRFLHNGQEYSCKVHGTLASNDGEAVTRWALEGHGIIWRSWWHVHALLEKGQLEALLPHYDTPRVDFYAVYRQRRFTPARVQCFIAFLAERLARRVPPLPLNTMASPAS